MTIDERIEALTMNLELLARDHEDTNKRFSERFSALLTMVESLARIAESHERRLTDLEGGER